MKVTLKNLTKIFPNKKQKSEVIAVNSFDYVIEDGELIGLLGPSGCGKSTTLNLLSGLLEPTSGSIYFGDEDVTMLPAENRGVGLVFQNYALYPHLTVLQNITFPLENIKRSERPTKEQMIEMATEAARLVQIDTLLDRKPSELSGGQQQRVAIARALVKKPRILLLDEPLSNLDARLRLQTREELRRIQKSTGITTVFVTHDQEEAMSISDKIVVMKDGVVHQTGAPQEVYDDPVNYFVATFLGTPPINCFEGFVRDGKICIGDEAIMDCAGVSDREVIVAIRPEGFSLDGDEPFVFTCDLSRVEVMGRDMSVVSTHKCSLNPLVRSIIDSDNLKSIQGDKVVFGLKRHKLFIFEKESGERIRF